MRMLVLMPTFNERENIETSISQVLSANQDLDLLIIDDNSPDGSGELANQISKKNSRVSVLHRSIKEGLGKAYIAGFEWAKAHNYDFVIQMDADGSHQPKDLGKLIAKAKQNRVVIGSRWITGGEVLNWPWYRMAISRAGNFYARKVLKTNIMDMTAGYRLYSVEDLSKLDLIDIRAHGYGFQVEMTLLAIDQGLEVIEVPISFIERVVGKSKMTLAIVIEAFWLCTKWGIRR